MELMFSIPHFSKLKIMTFKSLEMLNLVRNILYPFSKTPNIKLPGLLTSNDVDYVAPANQIFLFSDLFSILYPTKILLSAHFEILWKGNYFIKCFKLLRMR